MKMNGVLAALLLLAGAGPLAAQAAAGGPIEIPLRKQGGRLVVPVRTAGGAELSFVLSTGTAVTVLSESGARRAGKDAQLTLSGLPVPMTHSETVPDASLTVDGKVLDGMIGVNTLNRFDMLVDAPGGRLVLKPTGRSVSWEGLALSEPVRLRVLHGVVLSLDVELNGRPYPAMLDLGTNRVLANERAIAEAGVKGGRARVRVGGVTIADAPVAVSDHPVIQRFSPNGDGFVLVGAPVALDCVIAVSWVHRELRTCVR